MNVTPSFLPAPAPDELSIIAKAWVDNGSGRMLQKIGTVTACDQAASRH
jgi:hypothetical protein